MTQETLRSIITQKKDSQSSKAFAIKIVGQSTNTSNVPLVSNLSTIALQRNIMSKFAYEKGHAKVEGHTTLLREESSNAIINNDIEGYHCY